MFGNSGDNDMDNTKDEVLQQSVQKPFTIAVSIPKVEPLCSNHSISNEDTLYIDEMMTSIIPSTKGYKVKDPIIVLERCDKIWETLKVIKDVQHTKTFNTSNIVLSEATTQISQYVEYQPVLNNYNGALPNFKFSVKATKKLFNCLACGQQFNCSQTLKRHSQRVHVNCIPPQENFALYQTHSDKDRQKEPNVSEKDERKEHFTEAHSENCENELDTDVSSQSAPSPASNTIDHNVPSQQKKDTLIYIRDNINSTESIPKDQQKRLLKKETKHNEKPTTLQHNVSSLICTLCKQIVKNLTQHLIDYHKIKSPSLMLKNLSHAPSQFLNELDSRAGRKRAVTSNYEIRLQESYKNDTRQCEICFGIYKSCSFRKHVRIHNLRGETKENVHLSDYSYRKSPLFSKKIKLQNASIRTKSDGNQIEQNNENLLNNECIKECTMLNKDKHKIIETKDNQKNNNICSCGRIFREFYTLAVHKKKCTKSNEITQMTTESSENNPNECAKRNRPNRDSEIGINITIKKNNDSYEIIEKDNGMQNSSRSNDVDALSDMSKNVMQAEPQCELQKSSEISKYSEKHSILKIQLVDEDIDIDIEDDSQISSCNNNITSSENKVTDACCNEEMQQKFKMGQNNESHDGNVNLKRLRKKFLSEINVSKKCNICICGRKFYTRKALEVHMNKHSNLKLTCGYCNVRFSNVITWTKHQCSIREGKKFHHLPNEVNCPHCDMILNTFSKFDEHIRRKHFDSLVPYQCYHCTGRFPTTTTRKQHIQEEHDRNTCSICNKTYLDHLMSIHKAYHYGLGYPCHSCKKAYPNKTSIIIHNRKVHNNLRAAKYGYYKSSFAHPIEDDFHKKNDISMQSFVCNKSIYPEN